MALNQNTAGPGLDLCFFDLPRELRDRIYDLSFKVITKNAHDCPCRTFEIAIKAPSGLLVNRQFRQELQERPVPDVHLTITDMPSCEQRHETLYRAITRHDTTLSAVPRTATHVHLNLLICEQSPLPAPGPQWAIHRDDYSRWTQMQWIQRLLPQLPALRELSIQVGWVAGRSVWTAPYGFGVRDVIIRAMRGQNVRPSPSWVALPHLKRLKIRWLSYEQLAHRNDLRNGRGIKWCPETDELVDYFFDEDA